jgi:hypothetical protein
MPRTRTYGLDNDTLAYAARVKAGSGKTILPENLRQINKFVIGIKKLGLWNSMVCYPMRSIHNAGTGSTVYSLGGLGVYNGTLVNSPSWNEKGIIGNSTGSLSVGNFSLGSITPSCIMVYNRLIPSESTSPQLYNSPVNFGMNWASQVRTYITGADSTNTSYGAYTVQNNFHNSSGFNTTSVEIAGVGAPVLLPFYVYENNNLVNLNQYGNPPLPFNSRQNFVQTLTLAYGSQQIPFLLFISGRGANTIRSLYRSTLGIGLNLPY